tara:strand:- start:6300 stop:6548 length:249 start_codon:yes stop_codon:yes gene_type:complete
MIDLHPIGSLDIIMDRAGDKNSHPTCRALFNAINGAKNETPVVGGDRRLGVFVSLRREADLRGTRVPADLEVENAGQGLNPA